MHVDGWMDGQTYMTKLMLVAVLQMLLKCVIVNDFNGGRATIVTIQG